MTAVFLAALVLRLWPLHGWATDYDEGVYWQSLQAMDRGHALFSQVFSSQPPLFLWSVYPLYDAFGETLSTARLAVVLYSLAGIAAMYFLGRAIGGPRVGLLAAVLLAADPLYLWASHTLVAEVPALAAELLSLALIAEAARHPSRVQKMLAAGAGVAMGLGIMTKLSTIVGVVPSAAFLFFQPLELPGRRGAQARRETGRRPSAPRVIAGCLAYGAGVVAGIGLALWPFRSHLHQVQSQILGFHLAASGVMGGSLKGNLAMVLKLPAEVALGALAGIAVWRAVVKRATFVVPAALWFVATFGFLLMLRPLWYHHLVLLAPPLVLVASLSFAPFDRLEGRTGRDRIGQTSSHGAPYVIKVMAGIAVVVGLGGGLHYDSVAARPVPPELLRVVAQIRGLTRPGFSIVTDDQYLAGLASRTVPPQLVDTSSVRIATGGLSASYLEHIVLDSRVDAVVFATGRFDRVPGFRAWVDDHFGSRLLGDGIAIATVQPATRQ